MTGLGHLPYEEWLQQFGLFTEKEPEEYKIKQGMNKVDRVKFFSLCHQDQGTATQIEYWESEDVVMASGLEAFKKGLDRFLEEKSIPGYKP